MKKILAVIIIAVVMCQSVTKGEEPENLYARAAILIDADSGRILYGKNENDVMPMASTTKIMTLLVALKYGNPSDRVTFSSYAAKEPDVQLNALKGEQYTLNELLYLMMLRSYNDVAMMVAEYVGGVLNGDTSPNNTTEESKEDVKRFIDEMNGYAVKLGLSDTYFVTPNGLDGEDEGRIHSTTAYELALIAREALKSEEVIKICTTKSFSYREQNGKRSGTITNGNRFLDINKNAIGMKTGFTGKAGYCFVGATKVDERIKMVDEFNENKDIKVFLISLKAGGTGLNLTGADMVIHYDPWWNLAVQNQATDRAHRIGQTKIVSVYKLIVKGTIEEKILKMQESKHQLADEILSGETGSITQMSKDELLELFEGE